MANTRTSHVWRVEAKDNPEVWLDVRRIDQFVVTSGQGPDYQQTTINLRWNDEEPGTGNDRVMGEARVTNPEDPEQVVVLPVIDHIEFTSGQGPGFIKVSWNYRNTPEEIGTRGRSLMRAEHWDVRADPRADLTAAYERVLGTRDESQYVDQEAIAVLEATGGQGPDFKRVRVRYNEDVALEELVEAPASSPATPVRLDPFQTIINVQWGHPFVATHGTGAIAYSPDGLTWTAAQSGARPMHCGAYGNGRFILGHHDGSMIKSANGREWSSITNPLPGWQINSMVFGRTTKDARLKRRGRFVILFTKSEFPGGPPITFERLAKVAVSEDGDAWQLVDVPLSGGVIQGGDDGTGVGMSSHGLRFTNDRFWIYGSQTTKSTVQQLAVFNWFNYTPTYNSVASISHKGRLTHSEDGLAWSEPQDPYSAINDGAGPQITLVNPDNPGESITLPEFIPDVSIQWTEISSMSTEPVSGQLAIVSNLPTPPATSPDGGSWTLGPAPDENLRTMAWGKNRKDGVVTYVAQGLSGFDMWTSGDNLNWADASPGFGILAAPPTYAKDQWLVGAGGSVYRSRDGTTWTAVHSAGGTFGQVVY